MKRIVWCLVVAYFIFAAAVQYNDPDPLHWILLYLASALIALLHIFRKDRVYLIFIVVGMAICEMAICLDGFLQWLRYGNENLITAKMSANKPYIELGREFLGALIALIAALAAKIQMQRRE